MVILGQTNRIMCHLFLTCHTQPKFTMMKTLLSSGLSNGLWLRELLHFKQPFQPSWSLTVVLLSQRLFVSTFKNGLILSHAFVTKGHLSTTAGLSSVLFNEIHSVLPGGKQDYQRRGEKKDCILWEIIVR